ncbi:MAG: 6-bladed beta-propeller [Gammaproteobacteria bacterium]|jgi:DNA-binding beta-propeller fold protein YncE|nr:6-bladed beta-propeller [Gammaproteobacteria bacterium]
MIPLRRRPAHSARTAGVARALRLAACSFALLLSACASAPPTEPDFEIPVYPPPPAEPRFIWERTLLYNEDVESATRKQRFIEYATGASRKLKGLVKPFDVAVRQGRVYVSDSVQRLVVVFDVAGGRFFEIGKEVEGRLAKPLGLAIARDGTLYVADVTARRVMAYDADGVFLRTIGGPDTLQRPADVAVSPDGDRLYVVDTGGVESEEHVVTIFDARSGERIGNIGRRGEAEGEFNLPLQVAVAGDGTVYVVDSGNFRVQAFDAAGRFHMSFGAVGRFPGQFARPKGIAVDKEGRIYVIDTAFGNFQVFDPEGTLLMYAGERGHAGYPGKYMLPAGIAVDEDGRVYVVDQFFRKVDVFRPVEVGSEDGHAVQRSGDGSDRG